MIRALSFTTIAVAVLSLPGNSSALVLQINSEELPYDRPPLVTYQAGQRLFVVDSDSDYHCVVEEIVTAPIPADPIKLRIDGAEVSLVGEVSLSLGGGLPQLNMNTNEGMIVCSKNRIFRDRFVASQP